MATERTVKLKGSDDGIVEVEELVACESKTLKDMIEFGIQTDTELLLPNVSSKMLRMAMNYCRYHVEVRNSSDETPPVPRLEIERWDARFIRIDLSTLVKLISAASYLDIGELLDLASEKVAEMIGDNAPEEIRRTFKIKSGFSPEKENELTMEYKPPSSSDHK